MAHPADEIQNTFIYFRCHNYNLAYRFMQRVSERGYLFVAVTHMMFMPKMTRSARRLTRRCSVACFVALVFLCLAMSTTKLFATTKPPRHRLYVAFVSSEIPYSSSRPLMLEASLLSLVQSIRLSHAQIDAELGIYAQCTAEPPLSATELRFSDVEEAYEDQVGTLAALGEKFHYVFQSSAVYCSGQLSGAICHAQRKLQLFDQMSQDSEVETFFFLLEHDWILYPSQIQLTVHSFSELVHQHDIHYVMFDRGDRLGSHGIDGQRNMFQGTEYSNNPFIATKGFLDHLTGGGGGLCSWNYDSPAWERLAGELLLPGEANDVLSTYLKGRQLALMKARTSLSTMFHWDGRYFSWGMDSGLGPLNDLLQLSAAQLVARIDRRCRSFTEPCRPYYLRHEFVKSLEEYRVASGTPHHCSLLALVASFLDTSVADASRYVEGYVPRKICIE